MSRGINRGHLNRLRLLEIETTRLRWSVLDLPLDKTIVTRIAGVNTGPSRHCSYIENLRKVLAISERRACRIVGAIQSNAALDIL